MSYNPIPSRRRASAQATIKKALRRKRQRDAIALLEEERLKEAATDEKTIITER